MAVLTLVGALSVARASWAFPPQVPVSDSSDGAAAASTPFPVPDSLRPAVRFWRELFTRHGSDRVVVHDREDMDVIWRVIELPRDGRGEVDERAAERYVRASVDELRQRLRRLGGDPVPVDEEDRIVLTLAGGDPARLVGAADRLRTQRGVADHFAAGLARSRQWLLAMRQILEDEGVPREIIALPFVESMFNPAARSHAGAAGLWQLMPATARGLRLEVARGHDERMDVLKSTRAAARMLRQNYRMLGSWPLAITAYNHGPNGVRRAVAAVGSTDLTILIERYEKSTWGFASKNFYAEFLAAIEVAELAMRDESTMASVRD